MYKLRDEYLYIGLESIEGGHRDRPVDGKEGLGGPLVVIGDALSDVGAAGGASDAFGIVALDSLAGNGQARLRGRYEGNEFRWC